MLTFSDSTDIERSMEEGGLDSLQGTYAVDGDSVEVRLLIHLPAGDYSSFVATRYARPTSDTSFTVRWVLQHDGVADVNVDEYRLNRRLDLPLLRERSE